jgi:urease accessory protein
MSRALRARAVIAAEADGAGGTRLTVLRGDGPLALRPAADAVYLVGAAAGPLGGDELSLRVAVGAGSVLRLRSAAATLLLPDAGGARSSFELHATVGAGATLDCALQPLIAADGCDHRQACTVSLAGGASLRWREELVLGRHGEPPGACTLRLDVEFGRAPLLRHSLDIGRWHASPAVLGDARAAGSLLLAGRRWPDPGQSHPGQSHPVQPQATGSVVITPLAGPGVLVQAMAPGAAELSRLLDHAEARLSWYRGDHRSDHRGDDVEFPQ